MAVSASVPSVLLLIYSLIIHSHVNLFFHGPQQGPLPSRPRAFPPRRFFRFRSLQRCAVVFHVFVSSDRCPARPDGVRRLPAGSSPGAAFRRPGGLPTRKHLLRFAQSDAFSSHPGDERVEVCLIKSHDGSSSYRLMAGVFRFVCANGMVVEAMLDGLSVRQGHIFWLSVKIGG